MQPRHHVFRLLAGLVGLGACGASHAALTAYTSQASFLAAASATVVDTFDNLGAGSIPASPLHRTVGGYGYTVTTGPNYPYFGNLPAGPNLFLPAGDTRDTMTFAAFTGAPQAIGGNFFDTTYNNITPVPTAGTVTLSAVDSFGATASITLTGTTLASFGGFVSTGTITSLAIAVPSRDLHATVDNLTVGAAAALPVPEPTTAALLAAGLVAVAGLARPRRR